MQIDTSLEFFSIIILFSVMLFLIYFLVLIA